MGVALRTVAAWQTASWVHRRCAGMSIGRGNKAGPVFDSSWPGVDQPWSASTIVGPEFAKVAAMWTNLGSMSADLGALCPHAASRKCLRTPRSGMINRHIMPNLAHPTFRSQRVAPIRWNRAELVVELGPNSDEISTWCFQAKHGRLRPNSAQMWSNAARIWPSFGQFWPMPGQTWSIPF